MSEQIRSVKLSIEIDTNKGTYQEEFESVDELVEWMNQWNLGPEYVESGMKFYLIVAPKKSVRVGDYLKSNVNGMVTKSRKRTELVAIQDSKIDNAEHMRVLAAFQPLV